MPTEIKRQRLPPHGVRAGVHSSVLASQAAQVYVCVLAKVIAAIWCVYKYMHVCVIYSGASIFLYVNRSSI